MNVRLIHQKLQNFLKRNQDINKWNGILYSLIGGFNNVMITLENKETSKKLSESLTTVQKMGSLSGQGSPVETTTKCGAKLRSSRLAGILGSCEGCKTKHRDSDFAGGVAHWCPSDNNQSPYRGKVLSLGHFGQM